MTTPITYHCTLCDEPIMIQKADRLLLALVLKIEIKENQWEFNKAGYLYAPEEEKRISYPRLKEIIELPDYVISRLLGDIKKAENHGFYGGDNIKEKTLCKLNRLEKIAFEMVNDRYLDVMEEKLSDNDFEEIMALAAKKEGYDWADYNQQRRFLKKHKEEFCEQFEIVGLAEWYRLEFPKCSRQTMKRDFDVLNESGMISIHYLKEEKEYKVFNPWAGLS